MVLPPLSSVPRSDSNGLRRSSNQSVEGSLAEVPTQDDAGRIGSFASVGTTSSASLRKYSGSGDVSKRSKDSGDLSMGRDFNEIQKLRNIPSSGSSFGSLKASLLKGSNNVDSIEGVAKNAYDASAGSKPLPLVEKAEKGLWRSGGSQELFVSDSSDDLDDQRSVNSGDRSPPSRSRAGSQPLRPTGPSSASRSLARSRASSRESNSALSSPNRSRQGSLNLSSSSVSRLRRSNASFDPSSDLSVSEEPSALSHLEALQVASPPPALKDLRRVSSPNDNLPYDGRVSTTGPLEDIDDNEAPRLGKPRRSSLSKQPSVAGLRRSEARSSIIEGEHIRGRSVIVGRTANLNPTEIKRDVTSSVNYSIIHSGEADSSEKHSRQRPASHVEFARYAPKEPRPPNNAKQGGHVRRASTHANATMAKGKIEIDTNSRSRQRSEPSFESYESSERYGLSSDCILNVKKGVGSSDLASEVMSALARNFAHTQDVRTVLTEEQKSSLRRRINSEEDLMKHSERSMTTSDAKVVDVGETQFFYGRETFESSKDHARHRWIFACQYTLKLVKATVLFRHMLPPHRQQLVDLEVLDSSDMETQGLTYMLKSHQSRNDFAFSARVQSMLTQTRTPQVIRTLQRLLALRVKAFDRFTDDQQVELCRVFSFESRQQGTVIVKEGHDPLFFYFILSGQCEAFHTKKDKKYRINILNTGDFFGENRCDGKRTYSVATTMQCELLKVDANDYEMILHMNDSEYIASRVSALQKIPHFHNVHPSVLERMAQISQLHTFKAQEVVVKEGVENYLLYWIISGTCRAIKLVPFVKRRTTPECAVHSAKYTVVPHDTTKELMPEDELTMQLLNIRELHEGDHFPDMAAAINPERFNKIELMSRLSSDNPNRLDARAYISVVTNSKVEVISMTRVDYTRVATNDMILKIIADRSLLHIPVEELQSSVLQKRHWDLHKRRYVEDVAQT